MQGADDMKITVSTPIMASPRVAQIRGIFDLPEADSSTVDWEVALPLEERPWHTGLIVGPSGCGKTTIANHLWPERGVPPAWPADRAVVDGFPKERPFHVLSTGQQFRVNMARLIAASAAGGDRQTPIVVDEFTSVVDRTVAQIGSAAVARAVRVRGLRLVAVTCHEDVEEWLTPDWVYRPAEQSFAWRSLRRRPAIELEVMRCRASAWPLFAPHHYLSGALARNASCFLALWHGKPVAFSAWLPFLGSGPPMRREHRTVTLPDFQGVGIGNALSALIAGMWRALGYRAVSTTTHPAMMRGRCASPLWRMHRPPSFARADGRVKHARTRLTAGFVYVGPAMNLWHARALLG
jgi:GNAT superfamily N-acetyltransferase